MTGTLALAIVAPLAAAAGDWPQWRGPSRNGATAAVTTERPKALRKAWSVEVDGSPVAATLAGVRQVVTLTA